MVSVQKDHRARFGLLLFKNEVNNNSQIWLLIYITSQATFYSNSASEVSYTPCERIILWIWIWTKIMTNSVLAKYINCFLLWIRFKSWQGHAFFFFNCTHSTMTELEASFVPNCSLHFLMAAFMLKHGLSGKCCTRNKIFMHGIYIFAEINIYNIIISPIWVQLVAWKMSVIQVRTQGGFRGFERTALKK